MEHSPISSNGHHNLGMSLAHTWVSRCWTLAVRQETFVDENEKMAMDLTSDNILNKYLVMKIAANINISDDEPCNMNFYREAASILDTLGTKKHGSLKSIVFDAKTKRTPANQKRLYALLSETLKRSPFSLAKTNKQTKMFLKVS